MGDTRDELSIDFGAHHGGEVYRTTGWSVAEPTETWTLGTESRLVLPVPERAGPYVLSMLLRPMLAPPQLRAQRLRVVANGAEVGNFTIAQRGQRCCVQRQLRRDVGSKHDHVYLYRAHHPNREHRRSCGCGDLHASVSYRNRNRACHERGRNYDWSRCKRGYDLRRY